MGKTYIDPIGLPYLVSGHHSPVLEVHDSTRAASKVSVSIEVDSCSEILCLKDILRLTLLEAPLCDWFLGLNGGLVSSLSEHLLDIWALVFIEPEDLETFRGWVPRKCFGGFSWFLRAPA